jgi:hypothetical protein
MAIDVDAATPESCPNCGKPYEEWTENEGMGVISGGVIYCSSDCAVREAARAEED